ncbi:DNA-binding transcriptional regulator, ArsR family [Streptomyces zhaozhouensis]|uniref:DNA-binding transcriptional regulator, ArsR family n=1 Tax=Streptomyces zhaozhouensis TaxID=1300267 RepID=A0A286E095_9ACTN|nr:metalloregulator ArsR/SmtB family transcription factor [Streptomyces zhaozhouensis]SOD64303.1 DNA-binding transcriptional regulator, ArsR family [Streptomyces zhaozhouensis]
MPPPFEVLADPTRRLILDLLRERPRSVGELVDALAISQPRVSKHLRVLRDAGLATSRVRAQSRLYTLRPEPLAELDAWLAPYRRLWEERLDLLERHLDTIPETPETPEPPGPAGEAAPPPEERP